MSQVPNREEAITRSQATINELTASYSLPRPGAINPSDSVVMYTRKSIIDPGNLERGQILTKFLQLPSFYFSIFAPCLKSEAPYAMKGHGLSIVIKNVSGRPIQVLYDRTYHKTSVRDNIGWVEGDTGYWEDHRRTLKPNDEIELKPHYAIMALQEHSRSGNPPVYWGTSGAIPEKDDLVEVAYRASVIPGDNECPYLPPGEPVFSRNFKLNADESDDAAGARRSRRRGSES